MFKTIFMSQSTSVFYIYVHINLSCNLFVITTKPNPFLSTGLLNNMTDHLLNLIKLHSDTDNRRPGMEIYEL